MAPPRRDPHHVGVLGRPLNQTLAGGDSGRVADDHHPDGRAPSSVGCAWRKRHDRRSLARRRGDVRVRAVPVGHDDDDASNDDTRSSGDRRQRPPAHPAGAHRQLDHVERRRWPRARVMATRTANSTAGPTSKSPLVDERVDRPVEQIDAVADPPEPDEWGERQRGTDAARAAAARRSTPRTRERRRAANRPPPDRPWPATTPRRRGSRRGHHRRPNHLPAPPCIGGRATASTAPARISGSRAGVARYDTAPYRSWRRSPRWPRRRQPTAQRRRRSGAVRQPQEDEQGERPHPVELLLDRQRPVVVERGSLTGRLGDLLGVAVAVGEQDPVVDLGEGGPQVAAQFRDAVELMQSGGDDDAPMQTRLAGSSRRTRRP